MRLNIRHETRYAYARPARHAIEALRLTPRGHNGQFVVNWRIDVDKDCRLQRSIDPFGNTVHTFNVDGPLAALTIAAAGSIETQNTNGVVTGQVERFPPEVFLRETALTAADAPIRAFARTVRGNSDSPLDTMHRLMDSLRDRVMYDDSATGAGTTAAEAFALGQGVCQDFTHVFLAAARHLDIPARYVSGYLFPTAGANTQPAGHAWAEVLITGLGWVGFDAANATCPTDAYVRVAVGLDALGAAPVRGAYTGGDGETMTVSVAVTDGAAERGARPRQSQRQSQS